MRVPKRIRWTIYVLIIVGFIAGGFYLTATERPDSYTPKDAAEDAPYADPGSTHPGADEPTDTSASDPAFDDDETDPEDDIGTPDSDE